MTFSCSQNEFVCFKLHDIPEHLYSKQKVSYGIIVCFIYKLIEIHLCLDCPASGQSRVILRTLCFTDCILAYVMVC